MNEKIKQALDWANKYLASYKKPTVFKHEKIIHTSYSIVYKIQTADEVFYLKQMPEALFSEPKALGFLKKQGAQNIPNVLAESDDLYCFLMTSCGDISLRHLFKGKIDLTKLNQGISSYTKIQRLVENKVDQLLLLGIPDWRLNRFASLYYQLIQQDKLLLDDGLTKKEIDRLHQLYPTCIKLCEDLSKYMIPETISHCDFHENNMLLDRKTGRINIIDWGETVIAHPFFSLQGCLWNIIHFNELKRTDLAYHKLQSRCVAPWLDLYDEEKLLEALNIADQLNGVYAALGYERIYAATEGQPKSVQQEYHGSIAGCLRSFLSLNSSEESRVIM